MSELENWENVCWGSSTATSLAVTHSSRLSSTSEGWFSWSLANRVYKCFPRYQVISSQWRLEVEHRWGKTLQLRAFFLIRYNYSSFQVHRISGDTNSWIGLETQIVQTNILPGRLKISTDCYLCLCVVVLIECRMWHGDRRKVLCIFRHSVIIIQPIIIVLNVHLGVEEKWPIKRISGIIYCTDDQQLAWSASITIVSLECHLFISHCFSLPQTVNQQYTWCKLNCA